METRRRMPCPSKPHASSGEAACLTTLLAVFPLN
jgi:hypothetical protein